MASTETTANADESGDPRFDPVEKEAKRIDRALDSFFHVEAANAPGAYRVHSGSGSTYTVNLLEGSCTCPDAERSVMCKHMVRVMGVTGETPAPKQLFNGVRDGRYCDRQSLPSLDC